METKKRGLLIILSGPSGSGKDSVLKEVLTERKDIILSVSCTTRAPRIGEIDGKDYYFVDKEEFLSSAKQGKMLEYACYCDNYYGTPAEKVEQQLQLGNSVILEIEVQGARDVMKKCPEAVSIFLLPPSLGELKNRLHGRGSDSCEIIEKRLIEAKNEIKLSCKYDYVVVNENLKKCAQDIIKIIDTQFFKYDKMKNKIDEVLSNE
ncbi:MAG: guanylate kinase [Acutalibacteraceae bacterium]